MVYNQPMKDYKLIKLSQEKSSKVSIADYDKVKHIKWYASRVRNKWYASYKTQAGNGGATYISMHRLIMGMPDGEVDHINGDTLDNRRNNLRIVTHQQNLYNQTPQTGRTSKYKGVYRDEDDRFWVVQIKQGGRMRCVRGIEDEDIAGFIYDLMALDRFKEFARFNFPAAIEAWNKRE